MGWLDRILGNEPPRRTASAGSAGNARRTGSAGSAAWGRSAGAGTADEQAIERYRYLMATASPEAIEQTHAEAFARLTPDQRRKVLEGLKPEMPEAERVAADRIGNEPGALARAATRAEIRNPGAMERAFGRAGGGTPGGMLAGSLMSTLAGAVIGSVIGSAIGHSLFGDDAAGAHDGMAHDAQADASDDMGGFDGGDFDGGGFDV